MGLPDLRWNILVGYAPLFAQGLLMTLGLTAVALTCGLALGILLGLVSSSVDSPRPASPVSAVLWQLLRLVTRAYVGFFRGTPLFVQILLVHFAVMPMLIQPDGGLLLSGEAAREFRQNHGAFFSGALALTLNAGAYISEILRAGIQSIHGGQTQAAYSVGLTHAQSMRYVVLPQAMRLIVPTLGNSVNGLLKTTSVTSVISMEELLRKTQILIQEKFMVLELFAVAAIYYLLLTSTWDIIQRRIEARYGRAYKTISVSEGH